MNPAMKRIDTLLTPRATILRLMSIDQGKLT